MRVPAPGRWRDGIDLAPAGLAGQGILLDTGCPHLVVLGDGLPDDPSFAAAAPRLRRHPELGPDGANVDFVAVEAPHRLALRTFERGVEGETLASGTGCLAAALAAASRRLVDSPVACRTRGGLTLTVRFGARDGAYTEVSLEGEARLIYTGVTAPGAFAGS
jgi:diaminopimelate epimerase